jgi:arylformamidase
MLLATDWTHPDFQLSPGTQPISSALLVSGVYDLEPVRFSCVNEESTLGLKEDGGIAVVHRNSPALLLDQTAQNCKAGRIKVVVAVGGQDSPEFIRQSREYHNSLLHHAIDSDLLVVANEDHFSVVEQLDIPLYSLSKRLLTLIGCAEDKHSTL